MGKKKKSQTLNRTDSQTQTDRPLTDDEREIIEELDRVIAPDSGADTADSEPVYQIVCEEAPVSLHDFIPPYRLRFSGTDRSNGDSFVDELTRFLEVNRYLAMDECTGRDYARGFARAVAVAALFMDTLSISEEKRS